MKFHGIGLLASNLKAQREFYTRVLERAVIKEQDADGGLTLALAGKHRVTFDQAPDDWTGCYHFASDVPENQFAEAKRWLQTRTERLTKTTVTGEVHDEFFSEEWNAHMIYFTDPAGNILEFVARHTRSNASNAPFTADTILGISELGIATENVSALAQAIQEQFSLNPTASPVRTLRQWATRKDCSSLSKKAGRGFRHRNAPRFFRPQQASLRRSVKDKESASSGLMGI